MTADSYAYWSWRQGVSLRGLGMDPTVGRKWDVGIMIGIGVVVSLWASFLSTLAGS